MVWLGGWLKTVILIILLATFMDLLLPNHSMQRYVKMVVSLFIMMTLLSPVFELFQKNWDFSKLLVDAERRQENMSQLPDAGSGDPRRDRLASLETILKESRKLASNNQQQARQLMEERVAGMIKEQIETSEQKPVESVQVEAAVDDEGKPSIRRIRVNLSYRDTAQALQKEKSEPVSPPLLSQMSIEPVKPVYIEIGDIDLRGTTDRNAGPPGEKPTPEMEQLRDKIKETIHRDWQVPVEQIDISYS